MIGAAGLGNTLGILVASLAKKINPAVMVVVALLADIAVLVVAAVFYELFTLVALGLTAGLMQYLAKVSLDSTIQTGVPVRAHSSAFARGDTTLQMAWVIGGFLGVILSCPASTASGCPSRPSSSAAGPSSRCASRSGTAKPRATSRGRRNRSRASAP